MQYTAEVQRYIKQIPKNVKKEVKARGKNAAQEILAAEKAVLNGTGSGRVYGSHVASAPGEPPAKWTGNLRGSFKPVVTDEGMTVKVGVRSGVKYASYLEDGTRRMAARPFRDRVLEKAYPRVLAIYSRPYLK